MADPVGLSIGTTNLVAARVGSQPVTRRSVLTHYGDKPSEVGLPGAESGLVLRGFVERVGDPVPLVAVDGSTHLADRLLVDALGAMADTVGASSDMAIAVPAHWPASTIRTLSEALSRDRKLAPEGVPPRLVSDAAAALVALQNDSELTSDGLLVLLDFGGSGTSVTLVDAEHGFEPIAETLRHSEFSGDLIDQQLMAAVVAEATGAEGVDPAATAAVGSLARLREECRLAKERLSVESAATVGVDLPGYTREISFTRPELEALIAEPLDGVVDAAQDLLRRNGRSWSEVKTVAAVGGGASIPAVAQRLSEEGGARVVTTAHPGRDAAIGAALIAARGPDADAPTGIGTAVADANTSGIDAQHQPGAVGSALAWSQDDDRTPEPVTYTEANPYASDRTAGRPRVEYIPPTGPIQAKAAEPVVRRLPKYAVGAAGLIALFAAGGVVYSLTSTSTPTAPSTPTPSVATEAPPPPPPTTEAPPPPPPTTEAPPPPPETTHVPPPPPRTTTYVAPPPETVTKTVTPTTTAPPETTTTTTTPPTTTTTVTTTTPPTTTPPTTTAPLTTTTSPVTLPTPAMTTTYLTVPFIPVPIPIPVPQPPSPHLQ